MTTTPHNAPPKLPVAEQDLRNVPSKYSQKYKKQIVELKKYKYISIGKQ